MNLTEDLKRIPKAELHVHIEGTITPAMAKRKAKEHGITLPGGIFDANGNFTWNDFADCVTRVYDAVASTVRTAQDYEDIAHDYLVRCADEGCIYVELIISPDHAARMGVSYKDMVDGIARGIDKARAETGIEARMNATLVRHLPEADVKKAAQDIVSYRHPYVTGLDLAGAEKAGDIPSFRKTFKYIKDATNSEMGWRLHAGEAADSGNAHDAVMLNARRLGHGVRSIESPAVVREIVQRGVVLEVCPTSNVLAGIYPSYQAHPLRKLKDAGVKVTLNSDDPGLFNCSIGGEYQVARDQFGFSSKELLETTRTAIEAAFVDEPTRKALLKKVDDYGFLLNRPAPKGPAGPKL
jgi:adenosine deaminase